MDIHVWMKNYVAAVQAAFGERVRFIGLQGSRGRDEGREDSDIDTVMILDRLDAEDLAIYDKLLDTLPHRELTCGFMAGMAELEAWEGYDLFQLIQDTTPYVGSLEGLLARISREDVLRELRVGAGNVYHICIHNRLHGKEPGVVAGLYKQAVFALQAKAWLETGVYARRLVELLPLLAGDDAQVAETAQALRRGEAMLSMEEHTPLLMHWASEQLHYASMVSRSHSTPC